MSVGVIVGRFQIDKPHKGHQALIEAVAKKHGKVIVGLGISPRKLSEVDPLDYPTRERMIHKYFPTAIIVPVADSPSDKLWSEMLDRTIESVCPTEASQKQVHLYGSRSSFLPHYQGKHKDNIHELDEVAVISATSVRERLGQTVRDTDDFRAGIIYATQNKYPISYQVVDVAVLRGGNKTDLCPKTDVEILLCRKHHDTIGRWGFIGGFVHPGDESLEAAAIREVYEETDIEISDMKYLGSARIADWRFRAGNDKMLSAFFVCKYSFGASAARDDIDEILWVPVERLRDYLLFQHKALGLLLTDYLSKGGQ